MNSAARALLACCCAMLSLDAQQWTSWGGEPGGSRFSPLTQINRANVCNLKPAWSYHTGERKPGAVNFSPDQVDSFEATPLMVDGVLYFSTPSSRVIALDAETGKEIWRFEPQAPWPVWARAHQPHRGVAYWQSPDGRDRRILFGTCEAGPTSHLFALDARTGKPKPDFGDRGAVDLRRGAADATPDLLYAVTSPPAIYGNLAIVGAEVPEYPSKGPSGDVRAFDVRTGKLVWTFHTVPHPGEAAHGDWEAESAKGRTGANVWSVMSVDAQRGIVYLPIGSASYDFYGADRKGRNLYANSLVALDAATGGLIWYFQMVHHDVWDYDLPAQPVLFTMRRDGRDIPAVAQITKMGLLFILDRVTGKPLFDVVERPVPRSRFPGESTWPTQPFPVKPPPLAAVSLSTGASSPARPSGRSCAELARTIERSGLYVPYGTRTTLATPGELGGGNWSGGSMEPSTGRLFVNTNNLFSVGRLELQWTGSPEKYRRTGGRGDHDFFWDENQVPCQRPPWGSLTAVDTNTGTIAWSVPLGRMPGFDGNTGTPNIGGSIATAGGLVFIGATVDNFFRAFDTGTGKELWAAPLPAAAHATPMTYVGKRNGKQYVVVAAGGGGVFRGSVSDTLVAYALPN